jgi:lactaldehyde dehydrogenase/glycolaldehyde dehydrogenase
MSTTADRATLYVGGQWASGEAGELPVVNPATEERIASIPSASTAQVDAAIDAARAASVEWARTPAVERSAYLRRYADVIEQHADEVADTIVAEVGKPLAQAKGEVDWCVDFMRYMAEWDRRIDGDIVPSDSRGETIHLLRVPLGVVGAMSAWNFPVALFARKVAPALVTGNVIVLKPSEITPLTSILLVQLAHEHVGFPAGVLGLVTGGRDVGRQLVLSPKVDMVTLTGHRDTGKKVMIDAAETLKRVSLELGGKAPAIVWRDVDIAETVQSLIAARHVAGGQVCTAAERVFVHRDVYGDFVDAYTEAAQALRIGDPTGDVDLGPLVNRAQLEKTEAAVAGASAAGARLLTGGKRPAGSGFERGHWYEPTVFVDVDPSMAVMREEVFGPVTPIMSIDSLEQAFEYANDSRYGLSAYVFTNDYRTAMRAAQEVDFGEIYINRANGESVQAHHAGFRESGIGGEDGKYGVLRYTQLKTVYHHYGD